MPSPSALVELVARFERDIEAYRSGEYKETQIRREFIDPFFKLLGWDIDNSQGHAPAYREVIHEDAIRVGGSTEAPDYCFRTGGTRRFFVEAKKPSVTLKDNVSAAYQLRRYGFSSRLPLNILTDFEEFAVYDCRVRPHKNDKPATARALLLGYKEYAEQWDRLAGIFSREAVLNGSFDKYAESSKLKKGTSSVDDEFLHEIETWREILAKDLARNNRRLTPRDLNYAVQCTIDRIIFLRMCEDRAIEPYGRLRDATDGARIYKRLLDLFRQADERYNSGLFHFQKERDRREPDLLTPCLKIDDKPLRDIIKGLYYPDCPYEFSVLPAEILGHVYEKFLGRVIRLTAGHRAVVEEKPEVKKAGGVFYTPSHIVEYIVKNTVGKLLEGSQPIQVVQLKILDPACGSGSFLIAAYQHLLDWHRDWYVNHGPDKHRNELRPGPGGDWRLTTRARKRILLNNIYGVDIDQQAVEVTKLSLLLKVLEGESDQTLVQQYQMFHERALPDLADNINCGNSLVGPDFYDRKELDLFGDGTRRTINAFDWNAEFPEIMRGGGFDAVIGNPPWGQKEIVAGDEVREYMRRRYASSIGIFDLFRPFVERGATLLKAGGGYFGMVLPDIVLLKDYEPTRRFFLDHLALDAIDWWGMAFESAVIDACTIIARKTSVADDQAVIVNVRDPESPLSRTARQGEFRRNPRCTFNLMMTEEKRRVIEQLDACPRVADFFEIHEGVHSGNMRAELFLTKAIDTTCRELYFGRDEIGPYFLRWRGMFIRTGAAPSRRTASRYANLGQAGWYDRDKLLVRRTGDFVLAAVDRERRYASNNFFIVFPRMPSPLQMDGLCALLNSRFITWYFRTIEPRKGRVFAELKIKHLGAFPLPPSTTEGSGCRELNDLGSRRTALAYEELRAGDASDSPSIRRLREHVDSQINSAVCRLFGVSEDLFLSRPSAPVTVESRNQGG